MAKLIRDQIELMSMNDVHAVEAKDVVTLASKEKYKKYINQNELGYYVLINTWLLLIREYSQYGWVYVRAKILEMGLLPVIKEFSNAADLLIHGEAELGSALARSIYLDVLSSVPLQGIPTDDQRNFNSDPMSAFLVLARYPKRFSPVCADVLQSASINDFIDRQRTNKAFMRQECSNLIVSQVRGAMRSLLDWDSLCDELEALDPLDIEFTPGVTATTSNKLADKLAAVGARAAEYFYQPFGIPVIGQMQFQDWEAETIKLTESKWGPNKDLDVKAISLIAVPKNFKTARIIAPEDVVRQGRARKMFDICDRALDSDLINLHDQSRNQHFAYIGSKDGTYATLDLKAASDSITRTLLADILPRRFFKIVDAILPTHYINDGKTFYLHTATPMGNAMTFWLETVVFWSIVKAAIEVVSSFVDLSEAERAFGVYGDDIYCHASVAETVVDFLEILGFTVNKDKSFLDLHTRYRESCGLEYFEGIDMTSYYYPRTPIVGSFKNPDRSTRRVSTKDGYILCDTLTGLIDLQHKMFVLSQPASILVSEVIREIEPRMTSSRPDEGFSDLWDYDPKPAYMGLPCGTFSNGKLVRSRSKTFFRKAHLAPISKWSVPKSLDDNGPKMCVTLYTYANFLRYGPKYEDEFSRLMRNSMKLNAWEAAAYDPSITWNYITGDEIIVK
jgi:hypothetical protein